MTTEDSLYNLGKLTVNGSFITQVHVTTKTNQGRFFNITVYRYLSSNRVKVKGSCAKGERSMPFSLYPYSGKQCDDLRVSVRFVTATILTSEWSVVAKSSPVYNRLLGPWFRFDVSFFPKNTLHSSPHGIIGQSYDSDSKPRKGKTDVYPSRNIARNFTTSSQAEGAIDGTFLDYKVNSPYDTNFKYSRFGKDTVTFGGLVSYDASFTSEEKDVEQSASEEDELYKEVEFRRRLSENGCSCTFPPPPSPPSQNVESQNVATPNSPPPSPIPKSPPYPPPAPGCENTCNYSNDDLCDDGGAGSE